MIAFPVAALGGGKIKKKMKKQPDELHAGKESFNCPTKYNHFSNTSTINKNKVDVPVDGKYLREALFK